MIDMKLIALVILVAALALASVIIYMRGKIIQELLDKAENTNNFIFDVFEELVEINGVGDVVQFLKEIGRDKFLTIEPLEEEDE